MVLDGQKPSTPPQPPEEIALFIKAIADSIHEHGPKKCIEITTKEGLIRIDPNDSKYHPLSSIARRHQSLTCQEGRVTDAFNNAVHILLMAISMTKKEDK